MTATRIGLDKIRKILPHGEPFLFVDEVTEITANERIVARRELRVEEPHFAGHFPGRPIMPGVLITEALAQTSGLLLALSAGVENVDSRDRMYYLARADMKWTETARPGDTLMLESILQRILGGLVSFRVRAFTGRKDIASGTLTLARVDS